MKRSYFRKTIVELEKLFIESQLEAQTLKDLIEELGHRNVPKARNLLEKIKSAVGSEGASEVPFTIATKASTKAEKGRIYQGKTIFELEKLFSESASDVVLIREIKSELKYRNVPKAKALLKKIEVSSSGSKVKNKLQVAEPTGLIFEPEPTVAISASVNLPINIDQTNEENFPKDLLVLYHFFGLTPNCSDEELESARRDKLMKFIPINLRLQSEVNKERAKIEVSEINLNYKKILDFKSKIN